MKTFVSAVALATALFATPALAQGLTAQAKAEVPSPGMFMQVIQTSYQYCSRHFHSDGTLRGCLYEIEAAAQRLGPIALRTAFAGRQMLNICIEDGVIPDVAQTSKEDGTKCDDYINAALRDFVIKHTD